MYSAFAIKSLNSTCFTHFSCGCFFFALIQNFTFAFLNKSNDSFTVIHTTTYQLSTRSAVSIRLLTKKLKCCVIVVVFTSNRNDKTKYFFKIIKNICFFLIFSSIKWLKVIANDVLNY